ncbi:MAG: T9SS type A sorting domain-containing protein, partial [Lutimonas sp.]
NGQNPDEIFTFGGDRETFDRDDPLNFTKVDNDVWKFSLPEQKMKPENPEEKVLVFYPNYPNPFRDATIIKYELPQSSFVSIKVYDSHGKFVCTLMNQMQKEGAYEISWNGLSFKGRPVKEGIYHATIWAGGKSKTIKLIKE